jgi:meso-butanediol dehydrogenase / (S,S)-butanediol dehydrogenase / diacetyl reductase
VQRVAIITGGGSGIGAAAARRLAGDGWRVVITGRRREPIAEVAADIGASALAADMSEPDQIEGVLSRVVSMHGQVDAVVLNAGVMRPGRVAELSVEDWRETMAINVTGPFLLARAALPLLLESRGAVVAVGSIGAVVTGPGSAAYGASKAALVRLVRSIAVDYGPQGVRANVVNPGWVRSEMADAEMDELGRAHNVDREAAYGLVTEHVPARRAAASAEVAAAIAWLLSSDAGYVNGAVLTVDGGTSIVGVGTLAFGTAPQPSR